MNTCPKCKGIGLIKMKSIICPCKEFCIKCENREGYIIKPYEECSNCIGLGNLDDVAKVLCLNYHKKKSKKIK